MCEGRRRCRAGSSARRAGIAPPADAGAVALAHLAAVNVRRAERAGVNDADTAVRTIAERDGPDRDDEHLAAGALRGVRVPRLYDLLAYAPETASAGLPDALACV